MPDATAMGPDALRSAPRSAISSTASARAVLLLLLLPPVCRPELLCGGIAAAVVAVLASWPVRCTVVRTAVAAADCSCARPLRGSRLQVTAALPPAAWRSSNGDDSAALVTATAVPAVSAAEPNSLPAALAISSMQVAGAMVRPYSIDSQLAQVHD
jgi:hypothetical protein